jgi:hypothetical protein
MKFELFLGLNAAKAAGLTVTAAFLATVEVIEYPMTAWVFLVRCAIIRLSAWLCGGAWLCGHAGN